MHIWQLQEAKAKLSQLITNSKKEPQIISRHGVNESVVISIESYEELINRKEGIVSFFRNSPLMGINLDSGNDFTRDKSVMRDIDL